MLLPFRSLMPSGPPLTTATYRTLGSRAVLGTSVKVCDSPPPSTVAGTTLPDGACSSNVDELTDGYETKPLIDAITGLLTATPVAPAAGVTLTTSSGMFGSVADTVKTTSTQ